MKVQLTPYQNLNSNVQFQGNWFKKLGTNLTKKLDEFINPKSVVSELNQKMIDRTEKIAYKQYRAASGMPVRLSVKNGNKEFSFLFKNSAWHRVSLTKKGEELSDFEILHVKDRNEYDFYTTGGYPGKLTDEKFIKKFNDILEEWMPRLIKRYEKLDKIEKLIE